MDKNPERSCGTCVNCEKYTVDGEERWACENYDNGVGMPFDVYPPADDACSNWTDDPAEKGKPEEELRYIVDHFWDEVEDDW